MKLLLDPTAPTEGNGNAPPPPAAPAAPDPMAPIHAELAELRGYKARQEADAAKARAEAEAKERQRLADEGQYKTLAEKHAEDLRKKDAELAERDRRVRTTERNRELASALAGKPVIEGAPAQLQKLWADDFETVDGPDDTLVVVEKATRRPASVVVAERLASKEYSHFVRADSRGGAGASGGASPLATADPNAPALNDVQKALLPFVPGSGAAPGATGFGFGLRGRTR